MNQLTRLIITITATFTSLFFVGFLVWFTTGSIELRLDEIEMELEKTNIRMIDVINQVNDSTEKSIMASEQANETNRMLNRTLIDLQRQL